MSTPSEKTRAPYECKLEMTIKGDQARRLLAQAEKLGMPPVEVLREVITTVIRDDLIEAVLSDDDDLDFECGEAC